MSPGSLRAPSPSAYTVAGSGRKRRDWAYLEKKGQAAYTRAIKCPLVIAAGVLLAALIVAGGVVALRPVEPAGPIYAVADMAAGLRQHPQHWVGRTVAVRGVVIGYGINIGGPGPTLSWSGLLLLDALPPPGARHRLAPWLRFTRSTRAGRGLFNAPGTIPTLILRGAGVPGTTPFDIARQFVADIAARLGPARHTNTYSASPPLPRVYRVQLLVPARCPVPLAPPCYTAVVR